MYDECFIIFSILFKTNNVVTVVGRIDFFFWSVVMALAAHLGQDGFGLLNMNAS